MSAASSQQQQQLVPDYFPLVREKCKEESAKLFFCLNSNLEGEGDQVVCIRFISNNHEQTEE